MTSGIFLEVPLGQYYDEKLRYGVREKVKKIFGFDARFLKRTVLDNYIINGEQVDSIPQSARMGGGMMGGRGGMMPGGRMGF